MRFEQTIRMSPDVIFQEVSGETVLLDLASERYFGLDEVGTRFWQLIATPSTAKSVLETLLSEYEVDEEQLTKDLSSLIEEVLELGLVSLEDTK